MAGIVLGAVFSNGGNSQRGIALGSKHASLGLLPPGCDRMPIKEQAQCNEIATGPTNLPPPPNLPPGFIHNSGQVSSPTSNPTTPTTIAHDFVTNVDTPSGDVNHVGTLGVDISGVVTPLTCADPNYCNGSTSLDGVPNIFDFQSQLITVIGSNQYSLFIGSTAPNTSQGAVVEMVRPYPIQPGSGPGPNGTYGYPPGMMYAKESPSVTGPLEYVSADDSLGVVYLKSSNGTSYTYNLFTHSFIA